MELFSEIHTYIGKLVDRKLANPGNDIISDLVVTQVRTLPPLKDDRFTSNTNRRRILANLQLKPGHMEKEDLVTLAFTLIVAGNAAMIAMIGLVSIEAPLAIIAPSRGVLQD